MDQGGETPAHQKLFVRQANEHEPHPLPFIRRRRWPPQLQLPISSSTHLQNEHSSANLPKMMKPVTGETPCAKHKWQTINNMEIKIENKYQVIWAHRRLQKQNLQVFLRIVVMVSFLQKKYVCRLVATNLAWFSTARRPCLRRCNKKCADYYHFGLESKKTIKSPVELIWCKMIF